MGRFGDIYKGAATAPFEVTNGAVTIAGGATLSMTGAATMTTSMVADTFSAEEFIVTMRAVGQTGATDAITFNWVGRCHPLASWPTVADFVTTLSLNGAVSAIKNIVVDGIPFAEIKLLSIVNGDADGAITDVQAFVSYKY